MEKNVFFEAVEREFDFLLTEYDYHIFQETYVSEQMGNASVVFISNLTIISIVLDRGQVLMEIGERSKPSKDRFEITDVLRYFSSDEKMDVYQFSKKNPYDVPPVENQVLKLALLIRRYCDQILRGDFTMEEQINKLKKGRISKLVENLTK